ncbi:hypothetical protein AMECASPLE_002512 [Ameca splendens]|uniref:C2H2-type domain-containing protein n=1 Tax=Ameca splendens TaxID=208324 RepID=A0ABV1A4K7_9TELE
MDIFYRLEPTHGINPLLYCSCRYLQCNFTLTMQLLVKHHGFLHEAAHLSHKLSTIRAPSLLCYTLHCFSSLFSVFVVFFWSFAVLLKIINSTGEIKVLSG